MALETTERRYIIINLSQAILKCLFISWKKASAVIISKDYILLSWIRIMAYVLQLSCSIDRYCKPVIERVQAFADISLF